MPSFAAFLTDISSLLRDGIAARTFSSGTQRKILWVFLSQNSPRTKQRTNFSIVLYAAVCNIAAVCNNTAELKGQRWG